MASLTAEDVQLLDQEACASSRFVFVEGTPEQVDRYCEVLCEEIKVDRVFGSAEASVPPPPDVVEEIAALRMFEPDYKARGEADGSGSCCGRPNR